MKAPFSSAFVNVQALFFLGLIFLSSCTTQDFEAPDANNDVYRLKIENTSEIEATYSPEVSLYYIDGKVNVTPEDGEISPSDPAQLIIESEEGILGISVDVKINPQRATLRLILEKGTGTGDDYEFEEVLEMNESSSITVIRFGEVY